MAAPEIAEEAGPTASAPERARVRSPALELPADKFSSAFAGWKDSAWKTYRELYPAEAADDDKAMLAVREGWKAPNQPHTPAAPHFNHYEECHTGSYDQVAMEKAGVLRRCSDVSRWCAAYSPELPRERFLPPSVHGSLHRWAGNFNGAYRIAMATKFLVVDAGLEVKPPTGPAISDSFPDRDTPETRPLAAERSQAALMCQSPKDESQVPAVWYLTHATGAGVCVKNKDWYITRSYHMCDWGLDAGPKRCAAPPCPLHDNVLHVSMEEVNRGEFGHHVEQGIVPLLPYVDVLLANPDMKLTFQGAAMSDLAVRPHKFEGLIQYFEAFGVNRSRLIDTPYQSRFSWVVRFVDLAGDQGLFWPARAAAWSLLGMHDPNLPRILCPGAHDAAPADDKTEPCREVRSEDDPLAAAPFPGGPQGIPAAVYQPAVDVPVVIINRTGRRRLANFEEVRLAIVKSMDQWQGEEAFAGVRLRLLVHHDTPRHNEDKGRVMRMYAQSRVVVGAHGAGLTHKFLMRPASACLEFMTRDPEAYGMTGWVLMATSARSGLEHHAIMTPQDHKKNDDYQIDVALTTAALRTALEGVVSRMEQSLEL